MQAKELRIGNWVNWVEYFDDTYIQITGMASGNFEDVYFTWEGETERDASITKGFIKPIPLTEEILLKSGFTSGGIEEDVYKLQDFYVDLREESVLIGGEWIGLEFKYVHTFQNLYFALTGEELNIEL